MHLAVQQPADLDRVGLHDRVAQRHLAVAADGHDALVAHAQNRGRTNFHQGASPVIREPPRRL